MQKRTIKFRIKDRILCDSLLSDVLLPAAHLKNMLIILSKALQHQDSVLPKLFLNCNIMRAVFYGRPGGKKADLVQRFHQLAEDLPSSEKSMLEDIVQLAGTFDAKHVYKILKCHSGEMKGFFTKLRKGENASPPKARKLRDLSNIALPLDRERIVIKQGYLQARFGKDKCFQLPFNNLEMEKLLDLEKIISYRLCYDGRHITLNLTYKKDIRIKKRSGDKIAGLDPGVNNLCSVVVLDNDTRSLIISGADIKSYNQNFNKKKAKLASVKDSLGNEMSEIEEEVWEVLDEDENPSENEKLLSDLECWRELREVFSHNKTRIDGLYSKRKDYLGSNLQKVARGLLRYLEFHGVTRLITSRNILEAKNRSNMGRVNNQKFVCIPYAILLDALKLHGCEHGIEVIDCIDEAYTSKTNSLFGDVLRAQEGLPQLQKGTPESKNLRATVFQGRRLRGRFRCRSGKSYHSDLNGALNMIVLFRKDVNCVHFVRERLFKICSPKVLVGRELFEWLDKPYKNAKKTLAS